MQKVMVTSTWVSPDVETMKTVSDPEIRYLLGVTPGIGIAVGLDDVGESA